MPAPRPTPPASPSKTANARHLALEVLLEWEHGELFASDLVERSALSHHLSPRDTALLQALVFSVLRNLTLLDHWLEPLCDNKHLETRVHWLLRLGIAQLLLLDHAPHAAVHETVELAEVKPRGLVNAILRRTLREKDRLLAQIPTLPIPERHSHPGWLVARWQHQFGQKATEALCAWNQQPAPAYVRINQLHPKPPSTDGLQPVSPPGFYKVDPPPAAWLQAGQCYAQDPSTAHACLLLDPQPGDTVLDACAAPGGKTTYLAQLMHNQGRILACDASSRRLHRLRENLQRLHAVIAEPLLHDWTTPSHPRPPDFPRQFDRILVDAPCSNTGVMRRRLDVRWRLEASDIRDMRQLQLQLLNAIAPLLKPGGHLVYSTCSLDHEENEDLVAAFLSQRPAFRLIRSHASLPWRDHTDGAYAALLTRDAAAG